MFANYSHKSGAKILPYNQNHHTTFVALLKLWGLDQQVAEPIWKNLAMLDNSSQDELLAVITDELEKKQNSSKVTRNS